MESRLECRELKAKVKCLPAQIEKDSVTVSETLEKDLLTIIGGQNLETTTHEVLLGTTNTTWTKVPSSSYKICVINPMQVLLPIES